MNILFDQTEAQALFINGAAEYAQALFLHMLERKADFPQARLFSLYSSARRFSYEALACDKLEAQGVTCVDYSRSTLRRIVEENHIDVLFVTCLQAFCDLPLGDLRRLPCKVVCVIHDLTDEELGTSRIRQLKYLGHPVRLVRYWLSQAKARVLSGSLQRKRRMLEFLQENDADIVTVSDYTRASIRYNYPQLSNAVHVFYAPEKAVPERKERIDCPELAQLVESGKKYFLVVSADRLLKNADTMVRACRRFMETHPGYVLATVGRMPSSFASHVVLPRLSASDLEHAYAHAHALLYPSLFEGFGYPPLEAMKYGCPVVCSNVCSMPAVLEDAPLYFSPVYETDMYHALERFAAMPHETLSARSKAQYDKVKQKQNADLEALSAQLMDGSFTLKEKEA